jgi:S-adenosylmethionine-diacylglycerol 3-amino-3-carboxypropyl transferase
MTDSLVGRAVHTRPANTGRGLLERLFTLSFKRLVYTQVWEDPAVDLAALALQPSHTLVTISSAGCNLLNYLSADPARILAVDVNPHHLALSRLKVCALRRLPSYESFFRFWGAADDPGNVEAYDTYIRPALDADSQRYWDGRSVFGRRRITMFATGLYRHGVLGRGIGLAHWLAWLNGCRLAEVVECVDADEQRETYERVVAPLLNGTGFRVLARTALPLFFLGIPPAQRDELITASDGDLEALLRDRLEQLACGFPPADNYFAWQVFARHYDVERAEAVPPYLRRDVYEAIRPRTGRIEIHHASIAEFLERQPAASINRFVLLDAQDWMTSAALTALWRQINRTADPADARVICRTAGVESVVPKKLTAPLLNGWEYRRDESAALHARDRASIYGGFHLYARIPTAAAA